VGAWQLTNHLPRSRNVQADIQKDSFIAAYNIKNGKLVWKTPREEISSWGTPTVYEGRTSGTNNERIKSDSAVTTADGKRAVAVDT
jgi:hypothetical protein